MIYAAGVFIVTALAAGDAATGLMRMAAVTAVACPCAWALSVPTAFAAAIGGLSSKGILVRGGTPLEQAGRAEVVVLDKTGTLTLSQPKVSGITAFDLPVLLLTTLNPDLFIIHHFSLDKFNEVLCSQGTKDLGYGDVD